MSRAAVGAVGFAALTLVDQATASGWGGELVLAGCLGAGAGALLRLILDAWLGVLGRLGRAVAISFWFGMGMLFAITLALDLGLVARIGGRYTALAITAAVALLFGGVAIGLVGLALTPTLDGTSWLSRQARAARLSFALLMVSAAVILNTVEREWLTGAYPLERAALRSGVFLALLVASVCVQPRGWRLKPWLAGAVATILLVLGVAPWFVLGRAEGVLSATIIGVPYPGLVLGAYRRASDWDRDGYSAMLGGGDCDDSDPAVNPGRREVPRNGRDDNCRGGDGQEASLRYDPTSVPRGAGVAPVSVVLITVDTLSASHVGAYGYARPTTPNLDRWARDHGRLFENAYSPATSTQLAIAAMMRGVYARRLHWSPVDVVDTSGIKRLHAMPVGEWRWTLSEWLSRRGLLTLAFTDGGNSRILDAEYNLSGLFDEAQEMRKLLRAPDDDALTRAVIARLERIPRDRRFFLWVHYYGPHNPTTLHPELPTFGASQRDGYDHEILAFDRAVSALLDTLVARKDAGEPLVVALTSDHGEDFGAGDRTHGLTLSEDSIRVPLVISAPGLAPGRVLPLVTTVDLFPTLLGYTDTPSPPGLDGRDLRPLFSQSNAPARIVLAEGWAYLPNRTRHHDQVLATDGVYRFVRHLDLPFAELETVARARAGQRENLLDRIERPALEQTLDAYLDAVAPPDL